MTDTVTFHEEIEVSIGPRHEKIINTIEIEVTAEVNFEGIAIKSIKIGGKEADISLEDEILEYLEGQAQALLNEAAEDQHDAAGDYYG